MSLPTSKYYTTKEIAAMEGVRPNYILELVSKGKFMPPSHYGKPNRWLKKTVDRYYEDLAKLDGQSIRLSA
ncbi:hypothetical protein PTRA_a1412 [Pseudoalteromonas translucida KMM 520]|uniref:Helix-turn-helix domain-containing protein n=1 Tax=Pseudoalteromonas translucida KMM 520 TaxID=1315283 RepID=A0A0U2VGM4_9GAMM|nr:helix-turn-helix domain-containing protein [Pseudoalteromonas translucida]ALS32629.1 hypothetical protein PTRA_a1412 [Pseudoalteromonas translucida KMM 520]